MLLSKCAIWDSKKSIFIKNQEAEGLLSNLGVRAPLSKSLLNRVLGVFACLRAWRAYVLMCLRAYVLVVLTCLCACLL